MIEISLIRVNLHVEIEVEMRVECTRCKVAGARRIQGKHLARLKVTCSECNDNTSVTLKTFILNTVKNLWGYGPDDVQAVTERLDSYVEK